MKILITFLLTIFITMSQIPKVYTKQVVTKVGESKTIDNTSLLVITAPAVLFGVGEESKTYKVNSLKSFEDVAYKESDDLSNNMLVWERVKNFYLLAPSGTELHVTLFKDTITFENIFTVSNPAHTVLVNYLLQQKNTIRLIAVAGNPAPAGETHTTSISTDLQNAIPLAQTFANSEFKKNNPILLVFEGRKFAGTALGAVDLTALGAGNVAVCVARDEARKEALVAGGHVNAANFAAVGLLLGKLASIQVNQNIGRVTTPPANVVRENLPVQKLGFSGGQTQFSTEDQGKLHEKGYTFMTEYGSGFDGIFFADDRTCQNPALSNSSLAAIRITNKCAVIAYATYINLLKSTVKVDQETGRLPSIEVTRHVQLITDAIEANTQNLSGSSRVDELSGIEVSIDSTQNILTSGVEEIELKIIPTGTLKVISVAVGIKAV